MVTDIGFVSGDVEAFKNINLYDTATVLEVQNKIRLAQLYLKLVEQKVEVLNIQLVLKQMIFLQLQIYGNIIYLILRCLHILIQLRQHHLQLVK